MQMPIPSEIEGCESNYVIPYRWEPHNKGEERFIPAWSLHRLKSGQHDEEIDWVRRNSPGLEVVQAWRVQNSDVANFFVNHCASRSTRPIKNTLPDQMIKFLWHGTFMTSPRLVCTAERPFNRRYGSEELWYGLGSYFAEDPRYSAGKRYGFRTSVSPTAIPKDWEREGSGEYTILCMVAVYVGRSFEYKGCSNEETKELKDSPLIEPDFIDASSTDGGSSEDAQYRYDSENAPLGGRYEGKMYIVRPDAATNPKYLVMFKTPPRD